MSHFAELDENDIVLRVIVIEQEEINSGRWGDPSRWVQTSYNNNFRARFAGIGYTYDRVRDAFIPPKPFESWIFDEETLDWRAPVPHPDDDGNIYSWSEEQQAWLTN